MSVVPQRSAISIPAPVVAALRLAGFGETARAHGSALTKLSFTSFRPA